MNVEKRKILRVNLSKQESSFSIIYNKITDNLCRLYFDIVNGTTDNLWLHCTGMIVEYLNLLSYTLYTNVTRNIFNIL